MDNNKTADLLTALNNLYDELAKSKTVLFPEIGEWNILGLEELEARVKALEEKQEEFSVWANEPWPESEDG